MTQRQELLLKELIEAYQATAIPVPSSFLAKKVGVSPATVRNDLVSLEREGFIQQPHTSAGRIPTVDGYRYYIDHYLQPKTVPSKQRKRLEDAVSSDRPLRNTVKELVELVETAVLVAKPGDDYFFKGLSELFSKPEFSDQGAIVSLASVLDQLDVSFGELSSQPLTHVEVYIGDSNPFSVECSLIAERIHSDEGIIILAVLAPLRTNYNKTVGLLNEARRLIENT